MSDGGRAEFRFIDTQRAVRERLRLSRIPCEATLSEPPPEGIDYVCPSCGGSGEVWSAELIEVVALALARAHPPAPMPWLPAAVVAVLDVVEKWMEAK